MKTYRDYFQDEMRETFPDSRIIGLGIIVVLTELLILAGSGFKAFAESSLAVISLFFALMAFFAKIRQSLEKYGEPLPPTK